RVVSLPGILAVSGTESGETADSASVSAWGGSFPVQLGTCDRAKVSYCQTGSKGRGDSSCKTPTHPFDASDVMWRRRLCGVPSNPKGKEGNWGKGTPHN